jgi:hypothetical protein
MPYRPLLLALLPGAALAASAPDFTFEVQPLLSDRCFRCHGPDSTGRKADLRLDHADGLYAAVEGQPGHQVVAPGRRDRSLLWARLTSADPDEVMPPPDSHQSLSPAEIERIGRWIDAGAPWTPHWAFVPPAEAPVPPAPKGQAWAKNPVDLFVLDRLEREGLQPAPEADRATWLRRVSLDLTGLPPSEAEIAAFRDDSRPDAHARVVDRLLDTDAYAEHQAAQWLDLARYGDTFGYQNDLPNRLWPWRDWVLQAFRRSLPFDRFLTEQLAGDLLPGATAEQIIATAFNRAHRMTNEGGSVEEEFRIESVVDRVTTFGTAFLGLTLECARCHDHKYDPISQREFFQFTAFFNSIDESGLYSHFTKAVPTPSLPLYAEGQAAEHQRLREAVAQAEAGLQAARLAATARAAAWRAGADPAALRPAPLAHWPFEEGEGAKRGDNRVNAKQPASFFEAPVSVPGARGKGLRFHGDNGVTLKGVGSFGRYAAFSLALWVRAADLAAPRQVVAHCSRAAEDSGRRGYELNLEQGRLSWSLIHFWPGEAISVRDQAPLEARRWHHVVVTYDGSSRAEGLRMYVDGQARALETVRDHLHLDIRHRKEWGDSQVGDIHLTLAARFRDTGFKDGELDELMVFDRALSAWEARQLAAGGEEARDPFGAEAEWTEHYVERVDAEVESARQALTAARRAENTFITGVPRLMVMREDAQPRPAHLLARGQYDLPGEAVPRGVPAALSPWPAGAPQNRLGLAQWLTHPRHPLTARVAVNRAWAAFFDTGLVATREDFGVQGRMPSHPQLLDWLAREFQRTGWDWRGLLRTLALSATYRQSSAADAALRARDPQNEILARGPRARLSAEQVRDSALAASGLLVRQVGGESVKPYQPAGLWEESGTGKKYDQGKGEALYRRSLYTFWKRTLPPPSLSLFDAPTREACVARREVTATPMQALVLLNDPQFVEAARVLAADLMAGGAAEAEQIDRAFLRLLGRVPHPRERELFLRLRADQQAHFAARVAEARALVGVGESPRGRDLPPVDLAAATLTVSAILNLDEFMVRR